MACKHLEALLPACNEYPNKKLRPLKNNDAAEIASTENIYEFIPDTLDERVVRRKLNELACVSVEEENIIVERVVYGHSYRELSSMCGMSATKAFYTYKKAIRKVLDKINERK